MPRLPLAAALASTVASSLPVFLAGALTVQIQDELQITEAVFGALYGAFFASAAAGSLLLGRAAEQLGARASLLVASGAGAAIQLAIAGLGTTLVSCLLLLSAAGLVTSLTQPAANLLIAHAVPSHRQGFALGLKQAAIPVATLLGGLAVPAATGTYGWRGAFAGGSLVALGAGALALRLNARKTHIDSSDSRRAPTAADAPSRYLWLMSAGIGFGAGSAGGLGAFLVASGVAAGLSTTAAGITLTIGSVCGIVMRLVSGLWADRWQINALHLAAGLLLVGTLGFGGLALGDPTAHLLATPIAFGAGWAWPGVFNLAVVRAFPQSPGSATGVTQTGTYVGAVVGPLVFGAVATHSSFAHAWGTSAFMALAAAATFLMSAAALGRCERASSA